MFITDYNNTCVSIKTAHFVFARKITKIGLHVKVTSEESGQSTGAERAVLPLRVKAHFCDLRSPLRLDFSAPLRFHSAHTNSLQT